MTTFQDLITNKPLINLMNENYDILKVASPSIFDKTLIEPLSNMISVQLEQLNDFELLYSDSASISIWKAIVSRSFFNIVVSFTNSLNYINKKWSSIDEYKDSNKMNTNYKEGYSGYTLENQDGDFRRTTTEQESSSTNNLAYLSFFNEKLDEWADFFINAIKRHLLRLIY